MVLSKSVIEWFSSPLTAFSTIFLIWWSTGDSEAAKKVDLGKTHALREEGSLVFSGMFAPEAEVELGRSGWLKELLFGLGSWLMASEVWLEDSESNHLDWRRLLKVGSLRRFFFSLMNSAFKFWVSLLRT